MEEQFSRSFFKGFVQLKATMEGGTSAMRQGFVAGQEYRRANPDKVRETMEAYGYTAVEAVGVWSESFEHSGFRPDAEPEQMWWLSRLCEMQSELMDLGAKMISQKGIHVRIHVRIRGYLSPRGQFGHLGLYDHEIFATSISTIGG
jgi:hypothetical protein